jgi:DNA-binding MarR family transcriptional regulator
MGTAVKEDIDRIIEAILYLYSEGRRVTKDVARRYGLTGPQITAVKLLEGFGDLSLSELSERMSAKNSTITGLVDRMERDGLVLRERSDKDRRVVLIRLTDEGRKLAEEVPVASMEIFANALRSLTRDERNQLRGLLRTLTDRVRAEVERTEAAHAEEHPMGEES